MRRSPSPTVTLTLVATVLMTTGCATSASTEVEGPLGIIALGNWTVTGKGSLTPETADAGMFAGSWVTGTNPGVGSIYQRMIERRPETDGHAANAGSGGARASALEDQAFQGLAEVPVPELVVIGAIGGDIRCDGSDAENVAQFGEGMRSAIQAVVDASPKSRVVVTTQAGRPAQNEAILTPEQARKFAGKGRCDLYTPDGAWNTTGAAYLTGVIEAYEAEQSRVCAEFPQCSDDGGAGAAFVALPEYFSNDDFDHLNAIGQAAYADHMWPELEAVLDGE